MKENKLAIAENIKEVVLNYFMISDKRIRSKSKKEELVLARQLYCYLTKKVLSRNRVIRKGYTLNKIGMLIDRDHATVLYSVNAITKHLEYDKNLQTTVKELNDIIESKNLLESPDVNNHDKVTGIFEKIDEYLLEIETETNKHRNRIFNIIKKIDNKINE
ncbi:MAG: helix-turn-helix domain-containing protein [bacterium]